MEYITIKSILEKYDIILLDAFGVLVDDEGALPHAREFITHLNQLEREYFILTNGSKFLPEIIDVEVCKARRGHITKIPD